MIIIGAGMAGCIAAFMNRKALVYEAGAKPTTNHRAVLRFRSNTVAEVTGIPFKKVLVRKAIWDDGFHQPNPSLANMYSSKVINEYQPRSIWNLDAAERYVAPSNFHEEMLEVLAGRIYYEMPVRGITKERITIETHSAPRQNEFDKIISTAPMNVMADITGKQLDASFNFAPIWTRRATVANCNVHQTIYFPSHAHSLYRASLVGDQLIAEGIAPIGYREISQMCNAFGIAVSDIVWEESSRSQRYGKIAPISEDVRRNFMLDLTLHLNVFSLGRFATWRNILLDDVVDDMNKIQRMSDRYTTMRGAF